MKNIRNDRMKKAYCLAWVLTLTIPLMVSPTISKAAQNQFWVYIGTHNRPPSTGKGIYLYRFDAGTGEIGEQQLAGEIDDPGWQVIPDGGKFLYSIGTTDNHKSSTVAAFRIDPGTGKLTLINQEPLPGRRHDARRCGSSRDLRRDGELRIGGYLGDADQRGRIDRRADGSD